MPDNVPRLELEGVSKKFGKISVLDKIDLKVMENEFFAILGPSGSGKSTLLRTVIGIETPDEGRILINGKDVTDLPANKRNLSVVFQSYALYPNMTVYQNIAFPLKMRRLTPEAIKKRVLPTAERLGITDILQKNVTKISGGQKQRTALARALVREPAIFLLDEPLSNLDARVRFRAREELRSLQVGLRQSFVYVTHDQFEVSNIANRVAVLHNGKFEQISTFKELYEYPETKWVGDFIGNYPMNFLPASMVAGDRTEGEAGFRTEWIEVSDSGIDCEVQSGETVGDINFLYCIKDDSHFIVKHDRYVEPGSMLKCSVRRCNLYVDGKLVKKDILGQPQR